MKSPIKGYDPSTRSPGFSFKQLRYFVAVAETGQVQTAAIRVNISASAVTDAIKSLEQNLQTKLLVRHHKGMTLTHDGQQFLNHAKSILHQVNESYSSMRNPAFGIKDKLAVTTTVAVMGYFLPSPISRFKDSFPNIEVKLMEQSRSQLEKSILNGNADVGIAITSNIEKNKLLKTQTLFQSQRSLWCASTHPFANQDEVNMDQICRQPYVQLRSDEADRNTREIWEKYGNKPKRYIETASVEGVRSLVANNQGVTILSGLLFRPWSLDGGRLVSRSVAEMVPSMDIGLIWNRKTPTRPALKSFIDFFKEEFSA